LDGAKMGLLFELCTPEALARPETFAAHIKALPVPLRRTRPVAEAISTAGGVALQAMGPDLMLAARPGVFCAGEMLNWEAPTGGYLLTACLASGHRAAQGVLSSLAAKRHTI
jgi:predicted flavoprotein YhiN